MHAPPQDSQMTPLSTTSLGAISSYNHLEFGHDMPTIYHHSGTGHISRRV